LANLAGWHNRAFQVTAKDRASFMAALGFDAAVWELWPYLAAGASLHIPDEGVRNDAKALSHWLLDQGITVSFAVTAMAESLLGLEWPSSTPLRYLLTGADALRRRPGAHLPFALVNNYGPTEYTVVATSGTVAPGGATVPSIGRPIDNTKVYILDEAMHEVPSGEAGELYLSGAGLARGYRNQPELTAERFIAHPFDEQKSGRLYRTGDLARLLSTGEIEFLGRVDEQIKIRGFRVEPNEIVVVLDSCAGVKASAVIAREDRGEKRLVAYIVAAANSQLTAPGLRDELAKRLPDYMVPAVFVRIEAIPVTGNGKVDRQALPHPDRGNLLREEAYMAPRSLAEQRLATLLGPLLRVDRVGVNDNFFLLGGHSLLGAQLIARISDSFGIQLPLLSLFDHPTLAGMASEVERLILQKIDLEKIELEKIELQKIGLQKNESEPEPVAESAEGIER
jgi:acyl-CoA synthetase (AMP-forming)/AMP-acid ligase II